MAHKTVFVGIDVSKADFCVFHSKTKQEFTLPNTPEGHCPLIARFIAFRPDAGRRLPVAILRNLNVLTGKRRQLVAMRKRLSCQVKQRHSQLTGEMDDDLMALLEARIRQPGADMETLLQSDETLKGRAKILRSIPGIGPVVSAALIGQMPEPGHLGEKQAAALVGLAPINRDSGKYAGHRQIKGGRTWLREPLYQAALVASNHNPTLREFAKRLKGKGKPHKLVLIAVARKPIIIANAMLARNTPWRTA